MPFKVNAMLNPSHIFIAVWEKLPPRFQNVYTFWKRKYTNDSAVVFTPHLQSRSLPG